MSKSKRLGEYGVVKIGGKSKFRGQLGFYDNEVEDEVTGTEKALVILDSGEEEFFFRELRDPTPEEEAAYGKEQG